MNGIKNLKILTPLTAFIIAFILIPLSQLGMLDMMPGDIGDSRLNNYFLENIYQRIAGGADSLWHLSFFFPFPYVLGFSDNLFGSALIYIFARIFNFDTETAYQIWFLFGYVANFIAGYYALRRLGISVIACTVGALIFTFALPTVAHAGHAQLHYRFGLPLAIVFFIDFLNKKSWHCLIISIAWLVWQFYAGVYIGFFTLLLLGTLSLTYLGFALNSGWIFIKKIFDIFFWKLRKQDRTQKVLFTSSLILLFLLLLFLFYPYLQVNNLYGVKRSWSEIETMLPRPQSYFLSDDSFWWSFKDAEIFSGIPMRHEHQMFMGVFPLMLAFTGFIVGSRKNNGLGFTLITGMLGIAVVITLNIGGMSFWYLFHQLPLASAIRVMARLDQAYLFPIAYLSAVAIDKFKQRYKWGVKAVIALILPMIIAEAAMSSMLTSSKESWRLRISALEGSVPNNLSDNAILFFAQRSGPSFADELDAMWVSLRNGKKTMNGYSGLFPPYYDYEFGSDCAEIPRRVLSFLRFSGHEKDAVAYSKLMSRIVPIGFRYCDPAWWKSPPGITFSDHVYTPEEFRALSLVANSVDLSGDQLSISISISNLSSIPFAAFSSLGKSIRLSWRYIDSNDQPLSGWDNRKNLSFDIPAHGRLQIYLPLNMPKTNVAKGVQVSLVQESVFWGHDIGVPPLTIPFGNF